MKINYYLLLPLLALTGVVQAQSFVPEKLPEAINSADYAEFNPVLSVTGNEIYFVRANHPENTYGTDDSQDIWYAKQDAQGNWSEAKRIEDLNISRYNAVWAVADSGNTLLLHGRFNTKGTLWKKRGFSLISKEENGDWGNPVPLKISRFARKDKGLFSSASLSADQEHVVLSFSKRYNAKKNSLYVSKRKKSGKYGRPKALKILNLGSLETPYVSKDNKTLYFSSNISGSYNVYKTERLDDSWRKWSTPVAVRPEYNTLQWDSYLRVNDKGSRAWFAQQKNKQPADIYTVKLFEENPFIVVKGQLKNRANGQPLEVNETTTLWANDAPVDSLEIDADGRFTAWLPLGANYELRIDMPHHATEAVSIKADSLIEYTETQADLYATPWAIVKVSGNMMLRKENTIIPAYAQPRILVDGLFPDSVEVNAETGKYNLWIPYGRTSELQVQTTEFKPEILKLELDTVSRYQEIQQNLYVDKVILAKVAGQVLDRKTGKPLPDSIQVSIMLNDSLALTNQTDTLSKQFAVELEVGQKYSLSAKAEGYYAQTEWVDLSAEENNIRVEKDLYLAPIEVGESIRLENVFFATGKAELMEESFTELDRVVKFLNENPKMKIEIGGHTDNVGSAAYNKKLSAARAKAVADYIILKGVVADRLSSRGYGPGKPVSNNSTEEGRAQNRRVEFTVLEVKN